MTSRLPLAAGAAIAMAAGALVAAPRQDPPPGRQTFRTTTDLVTVDVMVRTNGAPVGGLTAADFVLLDNGVRQEIDSLSVEAIPVDVSLLVDPNEDVADDAAGMHDQLRRIAALVRPTDRLRVTAINSGVADLVPAQPAASVELPSRLGARGLSSAYDGLVAALLRRVEPNRRHLIVALTNGIDAISSVDAPAVRDVAQRSPATLHIVQVDIAPDPDAPEGVIRYTSGRERIAAHRCRAAALCSPTRRFWVPYDDQQFEILTEAAQSTGGGLHLPGVFVDRNAAAIFEDVFADYRSSYVLRYVPQGVKREGWHDLTVTIPAYPGYTVHARRGYAVDAPAPTASAGDRTASADTAIDALVTAYDRGDVDVAARLRGERDLASLIQRFQERARWPANPRREAAFVIELAHAAMLSPRAADRAAGHRLLLRHRTLLRHPLGPDAFERYWLWAALSVLQGLHDPEAAGPFLDRAVARFPNEPRFVLTRAFLADQRRPRGDLPAAHAEDVLKLYDAALAFPDTRAEAQLRKAWVLHRLERHREALALLENTRDVPDASLRYLHHFHRGQMLDAMARPDEARDAYLAALALAPNAQSPKVALMAVLLKQGDRRGAETLAAEIETAPADAWDPAWTYWLGDYRSYDDIVRRLREQTR